MEENLYIIDHIYWTWALNYDDVFLYCSNTMLFYCFCNYSKISINTQQVCQSTINNVTDFETKQKNNHCHCYKGPIKYGLEKQTNHVYGFAKYVYEVMSNIIYPFFLKKKKEGASV